MTHTHTHSITDSDSLCNAAAACLLLPVRRSTASCFLRNAIERLYLCDPLVFQHLLLHQYQTSDLTSDHTSSEAAEISCVVLVSELILGRYTLGRVGSRVSASYFATTGI